MAKAAVARRVLPRAAIWMAFCGLAVYLLGSNGPLAAATGSDPSFLLFPFVVFGILQLAGTLLTMAFGDLKWQFAGTAIGTVAWVFMILIALGDPRFVGLPVPAALRSGVEGLAAGRGFVALGGAGLGVLRGARLLELDTGLRAMHPAARSLGVLLLCVAVWGATEFVRGPAMVYFVRILAVAWLALMALRPLTLYSEMLGSKTAQLVAALAARNTVLLVLGAAVAYLVVLRPVVYKSSSVYPFVEWSAATALLFGLYRIARSSIFEHTADLTILRWETHQQVVENNRDGWYVYLNGIQDGFVQFCRPYPLIARLALLQHNLGYSHDQIHAGLVKLINHQDRYPLRPDFTPHVAYVWADHTRAVETREQMIDNWLPWRRNGLVGRGEREREGLLNSAVAFIEESYRRNIGTAHRDDQGGRISLLLSGRNDFIATGNRAHLAIELIGALAELDIYDSRMQAIVAPLVQFKEGKAPWHSLLWSKARVVDWRAQRRKRFLDFLVKDLALPGFTSDGEKN